mmetsp:Transcript_4851/g.10142  ORF Transcript_4851/g.10142 Transcript_4851/m.10142 type:complete len:204 (+) Transcript_4851:301-912(+)
MPAKEPLADLRCALVRAYEQVENRASVRPEQPVAVLLPRYEHLSDVLADLDLRHPPDLYELVHAAQGRLLLARHEVRADAEGRYRVLLLVKGLEDALIDVVRRHDGKAGEERTAMGGRHLGEHLLALCGEVCKVSGVKPYPRRFVPRVIQGKRHQHKVPQPRAQSVVRVDERKEVVGEGDGVAYEGGELAGVGVGPSERVPVL